MLPPGIIHIGRTTNGGSTPLHHTRSGYTFTADAHSLTITPGPKIMRIDDLLPVVRNHVYHPDFNGSFSIKSVAAVLVPGLSYEGLEVAGGGEASQQVFRLLLRSKGVKMVDSPTRPAPPRLAR